MPPPRANPERREPAWLRSVELGHFTKWVVLSSVVGLAGGLGAVAFNWLIQSGTRTCFRRPTGVVGDGANGIDARWWLLLLIPAVGGLLTGWLVQTFAPETEGHGTDSVIRSYHRLKGFVRARVILLKPLASAITIGTGGSAGQEGPVAQFGAGIGSVLATRLKLSSRDRRLFLLSGASAGVGAIFCSPLGGALFMPEVLYRKAEFEGEAITPCIISSIVAYATFTTISGAHKAVHIAPELLDSLRFEDPRELGIYLVLGILCAFVGWVYTKTFYGVHALAARASVVPAIVRPAIGGLVLGGVALALAPFAHGNGVFFGGYGLMSAAIAGELAVPLMLALVLAKILATSASISSGGSGGVFAPSLAIGALLGSTVGQGAAAAFPMLDVNPACFALVGMGGFFAGVAKVPITSVIIVSEMTGTYALLPPLMLVSIVHFMLSSRWTLYRAQVADPVNSPAHAGDFVVDVLDSMKVEDVMEQARKPRPIHEDVTLRGAMKIVADSHETHFPVVDDDDELVGIFSLTDLRRIFLENVVEDVVIVRDFMNDRVVSVQKADTLNEAMRRMTRHRINALPIVDSENPRKILALLERSTLGQAYDKRIEELRVEG